MLKQLRSSTPKTEKDPVCGMDVALPSEQTVVYDGKAYFFCCEHCRKAFVKEPAKYTSRVEESAPKQAAAEQLQALHTCPMHPEIKQVGPGSCPICGMALESVEVFAEEEPSEELLDMSRRFRSSLVFA